MIIMSMILFSVKVRDQFPLLDFCAMIRISDYHVMTGHASLDHVGGGYYYTAMKLPGMKKKPEKFTLVNLSRPPPPHKKVPYICPIL